MALLHSIDCGVRQGQLCTCVPSIFATCPNCEAAARERDELQAICDRQAEILTGIARALRGPEPPQTSYGWADLPERAKSAMREISALQANPIICGCGDHIGYAEEIGLSQDGAVCGNCATSRKDYDARTELVTMRARIETKCKEIEARMQHCGGVEFNPDDILEISREFRVLLAETEAK